MSPTAAAPTDSRVALLVARTDYDELYERPSLASHLIDTGAFLSSATPYVDRLSRVDGRDRYLSGLAHEIAHMLFKQQPYQQPQRRPGRRWVEPGSFPADELRLGIVDVEQRVFGSADDGPVETVLLPAWGGYRSAHPHLRSALARFWHYATGTEPHFRDVSAPPATVDGGTAWSAMGSGKTAIAWVHTLTEILDYAVAASYDYDWHFTHTARKVTGLRESLRFSMRPVRPKPRPRGALSGCTLHGYAHLDPPGQAATSSASVCRGPNNPADGSEIRNHLRGSCIQR